MNYKKFLPLIIFVSAIILSIGWYELIYEPARREILNMELETRRLREVEREILTLKDRHGDLTALIEAKENELDAMRNFLPPTLAQDKFIGELYRAAEFHRVQITSVQAEELISAEEIQSQVDGERMTRLEDFLITSADDNIISCDLSFKIFAAAP